MFDDKIICPAHGAAFNFKSGNLENGPLVSGIHTFEVEERDGKHYALVDTEYQNKRKHDMVSRDPNNKSNYVILGGGPAGISAALELRKNGYTGGIDVISDEKRLPYDRTLLNKFLPFAPSQMFGLTNEQDIKEVGIDFHLETKATGVDSSKKTV